MAHIHASLFNYKWCAGMPLALIIAYYRHILKEKRYANMLEAMQDLTLVQFLQHATKKEVIKHELLQYWQNERFDVLISPVVPFTAI